MTTPPLPDKQHQMGGKGHSDEAMQAYATAARADLEAEVQRLREALESARGSLAGAISKVRENPNLAESTCRHGMHGIDAALKETP